MNKPHGKPLAASEMVTRIPGFAAENLSFFRVLKGPQACAPLLRATIGT